METICDPTKVEELLINRNKQHFGLAQGTSFTEQKLINIFGVDGDAQATDDLIQGVLPDDIGDLRPTV